MRRRGFLIQSVRAVAGLAVWPSLCGAFSAPATLVAGAESTDDAPIEFSTTDSKYQEVYSAALSALARNTAMVDNYPRPVLSEGSQYQGIWQECGPLEGLVYAPIRPHIARANHQVFFARQKEDGQIPCWVRTTRIGFGQIQMVVPIAATAWELSQQTGDSELLETAYRGCGRWDAWLRRYRDTRRTGLCEGFCTWDTGHDNSPRWKGIDERCPEADARRCPPNPTLPRLCPDLSATVHGGRVALAAMARALGKNSEADRWLADAETIRAALLAKLYVAEDAAFYDLDARNQFVRIRGDVISRVLGEHVVDQKTFESIYQHQIHVPAKFWPAYPLPSIALDDPAFVRPIPRNSWGGASQALTALRAPRWMEHYGKPADLAYLMQQWSTAIMRAGKFLQQMDPLDGAFTSDWGDYSPAALALFDFTWRLAGVRPVGDLLEWNVRPPAPEVRATYHLKVLPTLVVELRYSSGYGELYWGSKRLLRTKAVVRLITDRKGNLREAVGTDSQPAKVRLDLAHGHRRQFSLAPNQRLAL